MRQLVQDVSTRLGFNDSLQTRQVIAMLDMCRFDQAWNVDKPSPWCVVSASMAGPDEFCDLLQKYLRLNADHLIHTGISATAIRRFRVSGRLVEIL